MARAMKINAGDTDINGFPKLTPVAKLYINDAGSMVQVKRGFINVGGTLVQFYGVGPFVDLDPELTITQTTTTTPKEYSRLNKPTLTGKVYYIYNAISATGWFEFSDTRQDSAAGTTWITNLIGGGSKFGSHNITLPSSTNGSISSGYFISPGYVWDQDTLPFNTTPSYFRYSIEATDAQGNKNTFISAEKSIISKPMVESGILKVKKTLTDRYDYDNTGTELFTTESSITGYSYEWTIRSSTSVTSSANILAGTTVSGTITGAISNIPQYNTSTYGNDRYGKYAVLRVWATNSAGTDLTEYFNAASDKLYAPVGTVSYSGTGFSQSLSKVSYMGTYTITLNNDWVAPAGTTYRYTWYRTASIAGSADVVVRAGTYGSSTTSSLTIDGSNGVIGEFYYCMVDTNTSLFLETIKAQLTPAAPTIIFQSNTTGGAKNFYVSIGNGASYPGYEGTTQNIRWFGSWNSTGSNGTLSGTIPYPSNSTKPTYIQTYPLYVTATGAIPNWVGSNSVFVTGITSTLVTTGPNSTTVSSWETSSTQTTIWFPYVGTVSVSGGNTAITQKRISKGSSLVVSTTGGTATNPGGIPVTFTYEWFELGGSTTTPIYTGATFTPNDSSYMGKQYRCRVTATSDTLTDVAYTDYYMVVPGAPAYTLSQNGQGAFSTSAIISNGATHYKGTYTYGGNTYTVGYTGVGSYFDNVQVGSTTVSMTLYGAYYNGSIYIDGYATTTQSVTVLAAPAVTLEVIPEISRQQDYNYVYTTTNGSWLYNPTSYTYNWKYSTDGGATFSTSIGTTQTITLDASYIGRKLYCTITGVNAVGPGESRTTSNVMAFLVTGAYPAPFSISSIVDSTPTPVTPSSVVISSNSSNVGTLTWTSLLTSVDSFNWVLSGTPFASSGSVAAVAGQGTYTYGSWTFSVDGNESASVTAVNNNPRVDINWGTSTNATSYNLTYTTSGGQTTVNGITNTYYPVYVASGTGLIVNSLKAVNTYLPAGRATTTSVPTTSVTASPKSGTAATATALLLAYPQSSVAPVITRTSIDGYVYTCTTGTWTATQGVTYSYQWLSGGSPITSGGQSSTLNASNAYIGSSLTCIVTATNSNTRSNSRTSAAVTVTIARPGAFTYSLSPTAVTPGTPTGLILSSNSSNQGTFSWTAVSGASDYTYTLSGTPFTESSSTTFGNITIPFTVIASGTETGTVAAKAASSGISITWGASSDAATYTLSYTDNSGTVQNVAPFNAAGSYTIPYATVQAVTLTATNAAGSRSATTSNTFPYTASAATGTAASISTNLLLYPQNSAIPAITRVYPYAYAYTCSTGTWTATSGVSYSYQWYVNGTAQGVNNGGTTATIGLDSSNIGGSIYCVVTATNTNGGSKTAQANGLTVTGATPQPFTFSVSDPTPTPAVPTITSMTVNSSNTITLNWNAATNAGNYDYYFTGASTSSASSTLGNLSGTGTLNSPGGSTTGNVRSIRSNSAALVSWTTSTYATSYTVNYTAAGTTYNQTGLTGNSWDTGWGGLVTINSVTAVNSYGSTGSSSSAQSVTPAIKYSAYASTTANLTYTTPNATAATLGTPTSGSQTGFGVPVSGYLATQTYAVSVGAGSLGSTPTVSPTAWVGGASVTVSGLTAGESATVTITASRPGYNNAISSVTGTSQNPTLPQPTFSTPSSTSDGFTTSLTNYSSSNSYTLSTSAGSVSSTFGYGTITVTGLAGGASATITMTATRSGYTGSSNTVVGTASTAPTITSGPAISWASGNNFTLSATASNASNIEFEVQFANTAGGTVQNTVTYFMGGTASSRTTGAQSYSWARTRVRANNTTTGATSGFTAYTGWS